jgi:hypothetical protein
VKYDIKVIGHFHKCFRHRFNLLNRYGLFDFGLHPASMFGMPLIAINLD